MPFGFAAWFCLSMRGTCAARGSGADDSRPDQIKIFNIIVPTDGTSAADGDKREFGTFSFYSSSPASYALPYLFKCGAET
jgi:hypothetical protein